MDGEDFVELLSGDDLGSTLTWARSVPCPCTLSSGGADRACLVCLGVGRYFEAESLPFKAGLVATSARARAYMAQTMGGGEVGDAVLSIPMNAACYATLGVGDRLFDQSVQDEQRVILRPGVNFRLPSGFTGLSALVRPAASSTALQSVAPPTPTTDRLVQVAVPTTLIFEAPRAYDVLRDLSRIRSFGVGLPKRWSVRFADQTKR